MTRWGSRAKDREALWRKLGFVPSKQDLLDLAERFQEHPFHARWDYERGMVSEDGDVTCSFNIKLQDTLYRMPYASFGFDGETAQEILEEEASEAVEAFGWSLRDRFPGLQWEACGRSGGWLVMNLGDQPVADLLSLASSYEHETVPTPWGVVLSPDFKREVLLTWEEALRFLRDLLGIEERLREAKNRFEDRMESEEFWRRRQAGWRS